MRSLSLYLDCGNKLTDIFVTQKDTVKNTSSQFENGQSTSRILLVHVYYKLYSIAPHGGERCLPSSGTQYLPITDPAHLHERYLVLHNVQHMYNVNANLLSLYTCNQIQIINMNTNTDTNTSKFEKQARNTCLLQQLVCMRALYCMHTFTIA